MLRLILHRSQKRIFIINEDRWIWQVSLSYEICQYLLKKGLNMQQICVICVLVAHWWAEQQHAPVWQELLGGVRNDRNSLSRVTIQDKTWVTATNQNPNSSPLCAKAHPVHISRKPEKPRQTSRAYWHLFWMSGHCSSGICPSWLNG